MSVVQQTVEGRTLRVSSVVDQQSTNRHLVCQKRPERGVVMQESMV